MSITTTHEVAQRIAGELKVEVNHDGSRVWIHSACGTRAALCSTSMSDHWSWELVNGPNAGTNRVHNGNCTLGGGRGFTNDPEGCMTSAVLGLSIELTA